MRHICLYIGVKIFSAGVRVNGFTRGSTRGPRGPKKVLLVQTLKKMKHNSFKAKFANYLKYQDKKADIFCALLVLLIPWDIFSISGGRNEWIFSLCGVPAQRSIGREKCRRKTYFLLHSIIEMNDSEPSGR